jgi:hypothetical protein
MITWLLSKLLKTPKVDGYRLIGIEDRRQEEEIKRSILRKLRGKLNVRR